MPHDTAPACPGAPPEPEIRTLSTRLVYRNRWISVREDRIRRADGSDGLYSVVEKKDFAVIAAVQDGRIWLVEQYRYPVGARFWELPQGTWDADVHDPLGLARAELREETGVEAEAMQHAGRLYLAYGLTTQAFDIFVATGLTVHAPQREPEEQGLVARAVPIAELDEMMRDGRLVDAVTVAVMGLLRLKGLLPV
jgi:ADP-ribose pyrophosphatase